MRYAVGSGLIKGKSNSTLEPQDNATRAEIAAVYKDLLKLIIRHESDSLRPKLNLKNEQNS